mmetsp:Transcript_3739/g.8425  ORF Transcript_3739/g.8425 Transcript_3739/m.8425 type:complete len:92 (-) Transcript_3739:2920-3195(-)
MNGERETSTAVVNYSYIYLAEVGSHRQAVGRTSKLLIVRGCAHTVAGIPIILQSMNANSHAVSTSFGSPGGGSSGRSNARILLSRIVLPAT